MARIIINSALEKKLSTSNDFLTALTCDESAVISFVNPFSYSLIANRSDLVEGVKFWFVDGQALCLLTNVRREKKLLRASFDFSSVASQFFSYAAETEKSVAIVGATANEVEKAQINLQIKYPDLKLQYYRDGYIKREFFNEVLAELDKNKCELLIVGMGTPAQEDFAIYCLQNSKYILKAVTCGGFITQTAIKGDYYHPMIKKLGLRWLQRAYLHKHVRDRLLKVYPKFIFSYLFDIIRKSNS